MRTRISNLAMTLTALGCLPCVPSTLQGADSQSLNSPTVALQQVEQSVLAVEKEIRNIAAEIDELAKFVSSAEATFVLTGDEQVLAEFMEKAREKTDAIAKQISDTGRKISSLRETLKQMLATAIRAGNRTTAAKAKQLLSIVESLGEQLVRLKEDLGAIVQRIEALEQGVDRGPGG